MALFLFTKAILEGKPIDVFNHGKMQRDFTYVDDIAEGVFAHARSPRTGRFSVGERHPDPGTVPYRLYNIGNQPVDLLRFIEVLESTLGKAMKNFLPLQAGDVPAAYADVADLMRIPAFKPATPIETGIARFVEWYRRVLQGLSTAGCCEPRPSSTILPRHGRQMALLAHGPSRAGCL